MDYLVFTLGLAVVFFFFIAYVVYDKNCQTPDGNTRSFFLFILGMLFSGFVAGASVMFFALERVCSGESSVVCSFGASIILQPIGWIVGMGSFLYLWVKAKPVNKTGKSDEP